MVVLVGGLEGFTVLEVLLDQVYAVLTGGQQHEVGAVVEIEGDVDGREGWEDLVGEALGAFPGEDLQQLGLNRDGAAVEQPHPVSLGRDLQEQERAGLRGDQARDVPGVEAPSGWLGLWVGFGRAPRMPGGPGSS